VAERAVSKPARPEEVKLFRTVADVDLKLWREAADRPPERVAASAGVRYEPGRGFVIPFMGGDYLVNLENRSVTTPTGHCQAGFQKALVLLRYLSNAQDLGCSGRMVTGRYLNGGDMFFAGPHALLTWPVTDKFGRDPEGFLEKAARLGLAPENQDSGCACRGLVLPHIAVGCILHPEDDEFPAELTYTFDSYAHFHLPLDGLWAMINVLAEELAA